jgi:hypothetical protein
MDRVRNLSETIDRPPSVVIAVAGDPLRLPEWAQGFATGIRRDADGWIARTGDGDVRVAFHTNGERGILDHDVTMPDGVVVTNVMRVLPNNAGSEVVFTLVQREGMTEREFEADAAAVATDLRALRELCEKIAL